MKFYPIRILKNNYVWLLVNANAESLIIDCGDATPVYNFILQYKLKLRYILVTHAHYDHIEGIAELKDRTEAKIVGFSGDKHRLPELDIEFKENDSLSLLGQEIATIRLKGHTKADIIYNFSMLNYLFCGDVLFSLGCGRIFEGSYADMYSSLKIIKNLPEEILIFSGHELTSINLAFARKFNFFDYSTKRKEVVENKILAPYSLLDEKKLNPFLNFDNQAFKESLQLQQLSDLEFFTYLRKKRNEY